jgi:hypothetical protein
LEKDPQVADQESRRNQNEKDSQKSQGDPDFSQILQGFTFHEDSYNKDQVLEEEKYQNSSENCEAPSH